MVRPSFQFLLACVVASVANAQTLGRIDNFNFNLEDPLKEEKPVVPILRFIDTQNPDGSYTYGYESGDGTYKVNNSSEKLHSHSHHQKSAVENKWHQNPL